MGADPDAVGYVVAWEDVAVGTALQGLQMLDVNAELGDRVEKGRLLAVLEHSNVQVQVGQDMAALVQDSIQSNRVLTAR